IKLSINAGVDILTFSNNISGSQERTVDKVHAIIKKFVMDGIISQERIDQSFRRIMKLKQQLDGGRAEYYRAELAAVQLRINQLNQQAEAALVAAQKKLNELVAENERLKKEKKRRKKN